MKKLWIVWISLFSCLVLFACKTVDIDIGTELVGNLDNIYAPESGYQYGNMQKNRPSGRFMLLGRDVLFDFCSNGNIYLYSYNIDSGDVQFYCKNATCTHRSCAAGNLLGNLEVYNGKLYAMINSQLIAEISEAGRDILEVGKVAEFFHNNETLYIKTADSSLVALKNGSNEPRMILEEYNGYWSVVFGHYLYATMSDNIVRIDLMLEEPKPVIIVDNASGITDGQFIYYLDRATDHLYRCNMDGSNTQLLLDKPVLSASLNFDDEYFYFRLLTEPINAGEDSYALYRFLKSDPTSIEKFVTLPDPAYQVFTVPGTGKIFVTVCVRSNGDDDDIYVINTDSCNISRLEIPE